MHVGFGGVWLGCLVGFRTHGHGASCNDAAYPSSYGGNYAANYVVLSV